MQPTMPQLAQRTLERFVKAFAPERILLFGSFAKGTQHAGSDIDLLIVTTTEENPLVQMRRARQLAADCFPKVDVVFATPEDVASAANAKSPFLMSILEKGIVVYQRS